MIGIWLAQYWICGTDGIYYNRDT